MYRSRKKEAARLQGEIDSWRCRRIEAERNEDFARTVQAKRRIRQAEQALADFQGRS